MGMRGALFAATVAVVVAGAVACDASSYLPAGHPEVECVSVPSCAGGGSTSISIGFYSNGTAAPDNSHVSLCADKEALHLHYTADDDMFLKNTYVGCNTDMYNQEVVEAFVSPSAVDTPFYHECEISPTNQLYIAHVHNPYLNGSDLGHTMIDCQASGIIHNVTTDSTAHSWTASLKMPWSLLADNAPPLADDEPRTASGLPQVWRTNFFRVIMAKNVDMCADDGSCLFRAWSSPNTQPAAFHKPRRFGVMVLPADL
uniref:Uncharacterized protein n=1 Tax=Bicosoecida sp. CB-2014 TaxID=1486930 RepID=A0A7S1CPQ5_9STRA|mmetsp:Transcript_68/g.240  ORF Transcript_68/g.240 Transcript_68/m.240 type:complete len:257 (+) Transcript_68:2-772(+)